MYLNKKEVRIFLIYNFLRKLVRR